MQNVLKNIRHWPRRALIVLVVVILGGYYGVRALRQSQAGSLRATGTVEATTVSISAEEAGQVQAMLVQKGERVQAGQELFRLDDTLLRAQQAAGEAQLAAAQSAVETAQAGYAAAQAGYDSQLAQARAAAQPRRLKDWRGRTPYYFDQPKWYTTQAEQISALQVEVSAAQAGLSAAQDHLTQVVSALPNADFVAAEMRLLNARQRYLVARQIWIIGVAVGQKKSPDELDLNAMHIEIPCFQTPIGRKCAPGYRIRIQIAKNLPNQQPLYDAALRTYTPAREELKAAQTAYNELLTSAEAQRVLKARAALAVARERYEVAQDRLSALQTGALSPAIQAAAANLAQAQNKMQQAQDTVRQAQANLELLNAQVAKLAVRSPLNGMILTRDVEAGEFVAPGTEALSLGDLRDLTITVYLPEDQYGRVHLGQQASVSVDLFPGQPFHAQVSHIADQAEFTPRNVQTVEGRSSTVYAVKLSVADPQGKLLPGMPAEVTFVQ